MYDATDRARAAALFADARRQAAVLQEPARTLLGWVNDRDVAHLGPAVLPHILASAGDPALSPERSPAATAPVFLLHGAADNVIPSSETPLLAGYLARQGNMRVRALLTPLVTHADFSDQIEAREVWKLIRFWKAMMDASSS
jgi:pimeloyl-ACP methyl ester carboxylesterase